VRIHFFAVSKVLRRFQYSVEIQSTPAEVWREFSDIHRLDGKGTYRDAQWTSGEPWAKGSRLVIHMARPFPITVTSVVSNCEPPYRAELINHCIGLTTSEWVTIDPFGSGTIARMTVEVIGKSWALPDAIINSLVPDLLKESLDALRDACEASPTSPLQSQPGRTA
jgi:hypothetical protein